MICSIKTPGCTYFGENAAGRIPEMLAEAAAARILVMTDKGVLNAGLVDQILPHLKGYVYSVWSDIAREPSYQEVERVSQALEEMSCDFIIAVGGGSVMDTAKLCTLLRGADYRVKDLLADPSRGRKQVKLACIPTTCGTGAEATCNAIVAIPEENVKKGIVNNAMIPDYVILDPDMIRSLPAAIIAATGVDALAHCVECYTSKKATPLSDLYAMEGAKLIFHNLVRAYESPADMEAKSCLMLGAYYGGVAITASGTTAVHALSYPLGGRFHIAHGVSNAILFGQVMRINRPDCERELALLCDAVFPEYQGRSAWDKSVRIIEAIEEIVKKTEIPADLTQYGVDRSHLDFLVEAGSQQRRLLDNNRRDLTTEEIRNIYLTVLPEGTE